MEQTAIDRLRHWFARHAFLGMLIMVLFVEGMYNIDTFSRLIPASVCELGGTLERLLMTAILMLFIVYFMKNGLKETGFTTKGLGKAMKIGVWVMLLGLCPNLLSFISNVSAGKGHFLSTGREWLLLLDQLALYLSVGLIEETAYRAVPINLLRNKGLTGRKEIWYTVGISSVIFGLVHLANMINGFDTPLQALGRCIQCMGAGMMYGAIYYRTGSLLCAVIVHAVWDAWGTLNEYVYILDNTASFDETVSGAASALNGGVSAASFTVALSVVMMLINLCVALVLLRKKKCARCAIEAVPMAERF